MRHALTLVFLGCVLVASAQSDEAKSRVKEASEAGKRGSDGIPRLTELLSDPSVEVRVEAVKSLAKVGTQRSLDPLEQALKDSEPEVRIRAIDSAVNFYLPGYLDSSLSSSLKRSDGRLTGRFPESDEWVLDSYMDARPSILNEFQKILGSSGPMLLRANAARAIGALRGKGALPELVDGLRSKDDALILQSLVAIQKMRLYEAAPRIAFLMRDLDERIQLTAIETAGLLGNKELLPDLRRVLESGSKPKARRAALASMAMLPDPANRTMFLAYLQDKDETARSAAAEGLGRIGDPADLDPVNAAWQSEKKGSVQLAMAFAEVSLGRRDVAQGSPLQSLINSLTSRAWRGVAGAYLKETARHPEVRRSLIGVAGSGTREQRAGIAEALGSSGGADAVTVLEQMAKDPDPDIAAAGLKALRTLRASLR